MARATHIGSALLALSMFACAGSAVRSPSNTAGASGRPLPAATLAQVEDTVIAARRLDLDGGQVEVVQVDEGRFKEMVRSLMVVPSDKAHGLSEVFSWAVPKAKAGKQQSKSFDELVAAYYDSKQDRIVAPIDDTGATPMKLGVFAHEMHHAIQHRHFDIERLEKAATDDDAKLALSALIEGDAQVTMGAYLGATHGIPTTRALRRITDLTAGVRVRHGTGPIASAGSSPQLVAFPYDEGMRFVADLYRAGGFELVNRAYERPPTSTMHILHPERYVAGIAAAVVAEPETIGKARATGTWGELRTSMVLAGCMPTRRARAVAAGWRGDSYALGLRGGASTLSWVSVWRDATAASAFADGLAGCDASGRRVHHDAERVLVTVNASPAGHAALARSLAAHPVTQPPVSRFADVEVPPRVPIPQRRRGRLEGAQYQSIWLGLDGRVPAAMQANIDADLELAVADPQTGARGVLALYDHVPRGRSLDALFADVVRGLQMASGSSVKRAYRRSRRDTLGPIIEEAYNVGSSVIVVEVLPLCAETGALVFVRAWHDDFGRKRLQRWRDDFRWIVDRRIPACRWLDPK